jgi:hypothetical protein
VRSNAARPSRTVWRVWSSHPVPDMIAWKTQRNSVTTNVLAATQTVSPLRYTKRYVIIRTVITGIPELFWAKCQLLFGSPTCV